MIIERKKGLRTTFGTLNAGDVFFWGDKIYMKTDEIWTEVEDEGEISYNACSLTNGEMIGFLSDREVECPKARLIIE